MQHVSCPSQKRIKHNQTRRAFVFRDFQSHLRSRNIRMCKPLWDTVVFLVSVIHIVTSVSHLSRRHMKRGLLGESENSISCCSALKNTSEKDLQDVTFFNGKNKLQQKKKKPQQMSQKSSKQNKSSETTVSLSSEAQTPANLWDEKQNHELILVILWSLMQSGFERKQQELYQWHRCSISWNHGWQDHFPVREM